MQPQPPVRSSSVFGLFSVLWIRPLNTRTRVWGFIQECLGYLQLNRHVYTSDETKIAFVLSFLTDKEALKWKETYLASLWDDNKGFKYPTFCYDLLHFSLHFFAYICLFLVNVYFWLDMWYIFLNTRLMLIFFLQVWSYVTSQVNMSHIMTHASGNLWFILLMTHTFIDSWLGFSMTRTLLWLVYYCDSYSSIKE